MKLLDRLLAACLVLLLLGVIAAGCAMQALVEQGRATGRVPAGGRPENQGGCR